MLYPSILAESWKLALAPAKFLVTQNINAWNAWCDMSENIHVLDPELAQAQQQALMQIRQTVSQAEASLPQRLEELSDQDRRNFVFACIETAQSYLLGAIGELYKAARVMSVEPGRIIEHQSDIRRLTSN